MSNYPLPTPAPVCAGICDATSSTWTVRSTKKLKGKAAGYKAFICALTYSIRTRKVLLSSRRDVGRAQSFYTGLLSECLYAGSIPDRGVKSVISCLEVRSLKRIVPLTANEIFKKN